MNIVEQLNRHPAVFTIMFLGALASIVGLWLTLRQARTRHGRELPRAKVTESWGILNESSSGGTDFVEGWLSVDTLTWGAKVPLPPFREPPAVTIWREDGRGIETPDVFDVSADQFTVKIRSSSQTGRWMWRARGFRTKQEDLPSPSMQPAGSVGG